MSEQESGSLDPFTASIRHYFAGIAGGALADQTVGLNFDVLPVAVGVRDVCDDMGQFSSVRTTEFFSRHIADHAAHAVNGIHYTNMASLSELLEFQVLGNARFYGRPDRAAELVETDRKKFEAYITRSRALLENSLASLAAWSSLFPPSAAVPGDWADPQATDNWKRFHRTYQSKDEPSDTNGGKVHLPIRSLNLDAIKRFIEEARWKKLYPPAPFPVPLPGTQPGVTDPFVELKRTLEKRWNTLDPKEFQHGITRPFEALGNKLGPIGGQSGLTAGPAALTIGGGPTVLALAPVPAHQADWRPDEILKTGILDEAVSTVETDAKDEVTVTFDYMFVKIDRPWIFWPLLMDTNWYIEGMRRGELTTGAERNLFGMLSLIPERMVVVRKLKIEASFTDEDREALGKAFAIGPFRLTEIDSQSGSLEEPGVQIIAYMDRAMPPLPPRTDPAIIT